MIRCVQSMALLIIACSVLHADMIRKRDGASVNGKLTKMTNGEIEFVARYDSGEKTFTIKKADVEIIEFNGTTSKSGPPPKAIGLGPPLAGHKPPPSSPETPDTIVLARGQQRRSCELNGIDEQWVHCKGKDGDYPRNLVLRIVLE
jgi:hypothetical protein